MQVPILIVCHVKKKLSIKYLVAKTELNSQSLHFDEHIRVHLPCPIGHRWASTNLTI